MKKKTSKVEFVKSLPLDMPAAEVVKKAKAAGLKLTDKYVYVIRSIAKKKSKKGGVAKAVKTAAPKNGNGRKSATTAVSQAKTQDDAVLRGIIADIGITRMQSLIDSVREKFADA